MNETIPSQAPDANRLTQLMQTSVLRSPVTLTLLVANLLVFALTLAYGAGLWHNNNGVQLAWGANFGPATQDGQWWRLATAMFLHFGILHLALNMWALWDVGRLMENLLGPVRFAGLYLCSGIFGNLLSLVVQGNQAVSGGASGAIFSLYGALLVFLWRERKQVDRGEFRWLFGAALVFTLFTLGMGLVIAGIDNAAHLGGLAAGALLAVALARPWTVFSPRPRYARLLAALLLTAVTALLTTHIPAPSYRMGEELKARAAINQFLEEDRRISERWGSILNTGQREGASFEQLAGRIDEGVTSDYRESFEQLSALKLGAGAPSAKMLEQLRRYAELREQASQQLSDGLRKKDPLQIRQALDKAQQAPETAKKAVQAGQPASQADKK
jgi:rhomboid protease GluP